jgi:large subunit ribosomal protein L23
MKNLHDVLRRPLVTEKSSALKAESNKIVFEVAPQANKIEIKKAVEKLFEVNVDDVRTMVVRGKPMPEGDE